MAVRRESVVLDLDDRVAPGLLRVAAAAEVADKALEHMGGQQANASRTTRQLEGDTDRLLQRVERSASSIDKYSGRLGLLVSGLTAVGPAAIPITAVAIPAVTALASGLGFAAVGAGTFALAWHGVSDALTKFNKAEAEPTVTNIHAAQLAMDKLPPSAQAFVLELHKLGPEVQKLQQSAGSGLFPGLTAGLHSVLTDGPLVQRGLHNIGSELGGLTAEAGRSLSSDRWRPFLRFVGTEAPHELDVLGHATGDMTHGLAELWMAFTPLNGDVNTGILHLAQDFDSWATSLGKTKDFQSFVQYIQTNGPHVVELLGDTAQLFVDIVQAAAPLGGPTIQTLDLIVKVLDAIANSPLATPLLLLAQINAILKLTGRGFAAIGVDAKVGLGGVSLQAKEGSTALRGLRAEAAATGSALRTIGSNVGKNAAGGTPLLTGVNRDGLANLAKGAALAGGMAFAMSGLDNKMGLTNTTALTLAGSFAGPYGAAAGAALGLTLDIAHANDSLVDSIHRVHGAFEGSGTTVDFRAQAAALKDLGTQIDSTRDKQKFPDQGIHPLASTEAWISRIGDFFTHSTSEAAGAQRQFASVGEANRTAFGSLFDSFGGDSTGKGGASLVLTTQQLQRTADRAQPAMQALGITVDDLNQAAARGDGSLGGLVHQIVDWTNRADSAAGRSKAVSQAFADMADSSLTTEQRVSALTSALDAMIDPMLQLGAARDAFHQGLNDLDKSLVKNNKTLVGNSDAAITNRNAVRTQVSNLKQLVEAQANSGASAKTMATTMRSGRKAIIDAAAAAGLNRHQVEQMVNQMHLTPKLIKTLFQSNAAEAAREANAVQAALKGIDRVVNVHVNVTRNTNALLADVNTPAHRHAGGGRIVGPGGPTSDEVPIWASDGEFMMRAAAVNKYGLGFMDAVNAGRFAAGGSVTTHATSSPGGAYATDGSPGAAATAAAHGLHALQLASAAATKQLDAERQQRQKLMQERAQLASTVSDNFRSPLFGDATGGVWGAAAAADPRSVLRGDIRGGRQYIHDISWLRREGLRGGALEDVQTLAQAQQALAYSPAQLRQISHLFDVRRRVSRRAGETAGDFRYGKQIDQVADEIRKERAEVVKLRHEVAHLRKEAPKNAKLAGDSTMHRVNRAVTNGVRRRRNP